MDIDASEKLILTLNGSMAELKAGTRTNDSDLQDIAKFKKQLVFLRKEEAVLEA